MSGPNPMLMAALHDATGGQVSLLFASGAALEGTVVHVAPSATDEPEWAVITETLEVESGGASREVTMRHMIDTSTIVAVGVIER